MDSVSNQSHFDARADALSLFVLPLPKTTTSMFFSTINYLEECAICWIILSGTSLRLGIKRMRTINIYLALRSFILLYGRPDCTVLIE